MGEKITIRCISYPHVNDDNSILHHFDKPLSSLSHDDIVSCIRDMISITLDILPDPSVVEDLSTQVYNIITKEFSKSTDKTIVISVPVCGGKVTTDFVTLSTGNGVLIVPKFIRNDAPVKVVFQ